MNFSPIRLRGGVEPKLIVAIAIFLLAGGILWWFYGGQKAVAPDSGRVFSLICSECKAVTPVKASELKNVPRQGGFFQCPKCKAFAGSFGDPVAASQPIQAP